jgi:hypothetical protein
MARRIPSMLIALICLVYLMLLTLQCSSPTRPAREDNLVSNGSFETRGRPSLSGWELLNPSLAQSEHDGGPGGGSWSLKLTADWAPTTAVAWQKIDNLKSGDVLALSSSVKAYDDGGGIIGLACGPSPLEPTRHRSVFSDSTAWVKVTLTDTVAVSEGDSVWVVLSSHPTEIVPRVGLFDEVRLVRVGK